MAEEMDADFARELAASDEPGELLAQLSLPGAVALVVECESGALLILREIVDASIAGVVNAALHWIAELYEGQRVHVEREGTFIVELAHCNGALGALALMGAILTRAAGDATSGYQALGRVSAELREPLLVLEAGHGSSGPITSLAVLVEQRERDVAGSQQGVLEWLFGGVEVLGAAAPAPESARSAADDDARESGESAEVLQARLRALQREVEADIEAQRSSRDVEEEGEQFARGDAVPRRSEPATTGASDVELESEPGDTQEIRQDNEERAFVDTALPEADESGGWALEFNPGDERQRELLALLYALGIASGQDEPVVVSGLDAELARSLARVLRLAGAQPLVRRTSPEIA